MGIQDKVSCLETEVTSVQEMQQTLDGKFSHMEENAKFVGKQIIELQTRADKRKNEVRECGKQILYLKSYSRRENLKFEDIPESVETSSQQNRSSNEDTRKVLANFMEDVLGVEDAKDVEFQRVYRMGKPRMDGNGSHTIIACFPRFLDRE